SYSGSSWVTYIATMEESKAGEEDLYFANVNATRADRPFNYPDANPANAKVSKVPGKRRGLSIMLKVMAGDTIEISAKAFYNMDNAAPGRGIDVAPILGSIISSMTNPVATAVGEASQVATTVHTSAGHSSRYVTLPDKGLQVKTVQPRSGVNFVLYNSAFEVVEENTGYLPVDDKINAIQTLSTDKMVMAEAGFIEVFVDNQANTAVYYDNMMVVHSSGSSNVLEVNAYYPYGMLMPGLSLIAPPGKYNAYKHSAKELQKELSLQWYDHGARMYDPTVSRWWVPDPLAEKYYSLSPYNYCANNPILFVDPDGMDKYYFDADGNITEIEEQSWLRNLFKGHTGYMSDGTEFFISNHIAKHLYNDFSYNTLNSDPEANFGISTSIETRESLENLLDIAMSDFQKSDYLPGLNIKKAFEESINMGRLDFSESFKYSLPRLTIINTSKGLEAQNAHNIGNFLTGAAFQKLNISQELGRLGAHLHAIFFQGHIFGDSPDDQRMLLEGWNWSAGRRMNY
ncbi:MAG TPA: RHS repeat-associated core domain-containing protein, partial [Candidatus Cloacimonadota bacterium]|nr:RHS repeat-associated core domain-containing protein [Candidatus Cloacimonadota bacterium]